MKKMNPSKKPALENQRFFQPIKGIKASRPGSLGFPLVVLDGGFSSYVNDDETERTDEETEFTDEETEHTDDEAESTDEETEHSDDENENTDGETQYTDDDFDYLDYLTDPDEETEGPDDPEELEGPEETKGPGGAGDPEETEGPEDPKGSDCDAPLPPATSKLSSGDLALIKKIGLSQQCQLFLNLYKGNWRFFYDKYDEAALKLCRILIPWCKGDTAKVDRIFRSSGLMRKEWDDKCNSPTLGEQTVTNALNSYLNLYKRELSDTSGQKPPQVSRALQVQLMTYTFDDVGNGERFADKFACLLRYNYTSKSWMYFDGSRWTWDSDGKVRRLADQLLEEMRSTYISYKKPNNSLKSDAETKIAARYERHIEACGTNRSINNMITEAEHRMAIQTTDFDQDRDLLNTLNGIINLKTYDLIPHRHELKVSKLADVAYSIDADCPQWQNFLDRIFNHDRELIKFMQMATGYSLTGDTKEHCIFLLYGTGRNGKSTFLDVISTMMGDYAANVQADTLMNKQAHSGPSSDIARLQGKRFVTVPEPNKDRVFDEGLIKQLTGGDSVTASYKYQNEFEYKPEFKIWMTTNYKPVIRGTDEGIWSRIHLVPFTVRIPDEEMDKNLKEKLLKELPGILNWALAGCREWQEKGGLCVPASVKNASAEYRKDMDIMQSFLDECTEPGDEVSVTKLFERYRLWAENRKEYVLSATKFGREMGNRFKSRKSNNLKYYIGISLKEYSHPTDEVFGRIKI